MQSFKEDISQEHKNPFKERGIYPFSEIGRCVVDKNTAEIKRWCSEDDSNYDKEGNPINLDQDNEDIMVYIPAFYYKREWEGEVLTDSILNKVPDSLEYNGYKIHPAFVKKDGTIRPYFLCGAFLGYIKDNQLRSIPNIKPTGSKTISAFRDSARQGRGISFGITNFVQTSALQILYKVAFQDLNSQNVIGKGWSSKSTSGTCGATMALGNRSGYLGVDGDQISFLGIEDFYGNMMQFMDGIFITDEGYHVSNINENFGSIETYDLVPSKVITSSGYIKKMEKIDGKYDVLNLPSQVGGADFSYYTDYLWCRGAGKTNIVGFGGLWLYGLYDGVWCLYCSYVASSTDGAWGARLSYSEE